MPQHIWVNPSSLKKDKKEIQMDGVSLYVEASPYDIPRSAEGRYKEATKQFEITFHYIDDEKPDRNPVALEGVIFLKGRFSGKILKISLEVDKPQLENVGVIQQLWTKVTDALSQIRNQTVKNEDSALSSHFDVMEDVLDKENFDVLLKD